MTTPINRQPFIAARRHLLNVVSKPVQTWTTHPPGWRADYVYRDLYAIPMRLAAAGFRVSITHDVDECIVEVKKDLMNGVHLHLVGEPWTYPEAMTLITTMAPFAIADLEDAALSRQQAGTSEVNGAL